MTEWSLERIHSPKKENLIGSSEWTTPLTTAVIVWLIKAIKFQINLFWSVASQQNKHELFSSQVWQNECDKYSINTMRYIQILAWLQL